jgi:hypothetical protein
MHLKFRNLFMMYVHEITFLNTFFLKFFVINSKLDKLLLILNESKNTQTKNCLIHFVQFSQLKRKDNKSEKRSLYS